MKVMKPETKAIRRCNLLKLWVAQAEEVISNVDEAAINRECGGFSLHLPEVCVNSKRNLKTGKYEISVSFATDTGRTFSIAVPHFEMLEIARYSGHVMFDYERDVVAFCMDDLADEKYTMEELREVFGENVDEETLPEENIVISMKAFPETFDNI